MGNYVEISIELTSGRKIDPVKIEKGVFFKNNGGKYFVDDNGSLKKAGSGNTTSEVSSIEMTEYQYSVFTAIANNAKEESGDKLILSKLDLQTAMDYYNNGEFKNDINKDLKSGYSIKDTNLFSAKKTVSVTVESNTDSKSTANISFGVMDKFDAPIESNNAVASNIQKTTALTNSKKPSKVASSDKFEFYEQIPASYNKYITRIAKNLDVSEDFIRLVISSENMERVAKEKIKGVITVGFGHTNKAQSNTNFKEGYVISDETAFAWLEQDLRDVIKLAKFYYPTYDSIPQSLKEGLLDLIFNRGIGTARDISSLNANIANGYYGNAALRLRQESDDAGIRKRSVYRFMHAIKDLSEESKRVAISNFENRDAYCSKTQNLLISAGYPLDGKMLSRDWNRVL